MRASICGFAATLAVAVGDHAQIATYGRIAAEADPGAQFAFWGGQRLMHAGIVGTAPGATDDEIDDAVARFAEGEARYLGIGARSGLSCFRAALAANLARHGRLTEAESWAVAARDELDGHGERWPEPLVLLAEGVVAASVGETDVARARFDAAERVALERAAPVLQRRVAAERVAFGC